MAERRVRPGRPARRAPTTQLSYRRFMLDLYGAQPIEGGAWLHGVRDWAARPRRRRSMRRSAEGDVRAHRQRVLAGHSGQAARQRRRHPRLGLRLRAERGGARSMPPRTTSTSSSSASRARCWRSAPSSRATSSSSSWRALSATVSQRASDLASGAEQPNGKYVTITLSDFIVAAMTTCRRRCLAKVNRWSPVDRLLGGGLGLHHSRATPSTTWRRPIARAKTRKLQTQPRPHL